MGLGELIAGLYLALAGVTLAAELPVVLFWGLQTGARRRIRSWVLSAIVANAVAHPVAWIAASAWFASSGQHPVALFAGATLVVTAIESLLYRLMLETTWSTAVRLGMCANAVSAVAGGLFLVSIRQ